MAEAPTAIDQSLPEKTFHQEDRILASPEGDFPLRVYTPEKPNGHPRSVLFIPGLSATPDIGSAIPEGLCEQGFTVAVPSFPTLPEGTPKFLPLVNAEKIHASTIAASVNAIGVGNEGGVAQVDLVAHSKGAMDGVKFASEHPENVRNMVLVSPAGITAKGFFDVLVGQMIVGATESGNQENAIKVEQGPDSPMAQRIEATKKGMDDYKHLNPLAFAQEVLTMSNDRIQGLFANLKEKGVKVCIVSNLDDKIFTPETYQPNLPAARANVGKPEDEQLPLDKEPVITASDIAGFITTPGVHDSDKYKGPESPTIKAYGSLLRTMENQRNASITPSPTV